MNRILLPFAAAMAFAAATIGHAALAQDSPVTLSGDVMVERPVTGAEGQERTELVRPEKVVPGDRLIFTTAYRNGGAEPVTDFVVTNPLPAAVRLAPDADPALIVSVDGGENWGTLGTLRVAQVDGTERAATHDDVTHLRWTLAAVAPGETGQLNYPAIVR